MQGGLMKGGLIHNLLMIIFLVYNDLLYVVAH